MRDKDKSHAQLVQELASLRQQVAELKAHNEELDAFAHIVAHDLKNPLSHIVGFAEVLATDYATLPGEELSHYLHTVARLGRKMHNIIDELLLLVTVRRGKVDTEPLDMTGIVSAALQRLDDWIKGHQTDVILPPEWPVALGDSPWVEEVWVNYLSNAIKYGGKPPRVELGATEQADGNVRFWVRDNGPGLTPEEQARLFPSSMRLDQIRVQGYGLGLPTVQRMVEQLGGEVGVESEVGRGSVFWFTLSGAR